MGFPARRGVTARHCTICLVIASQIFLTACGNTRGRAGYKDQVTVGEQYLNNGRYEEGYAILEEVASTNRRSSKTSRSLGDVYFRQAAFSKALMHYQKTMEYGDKFAGLIGQGRVALAQNRGQDALALYAAALEKQPKSVVALNGVGVAYDILGDYKQAQTYYVRALALAPNDFDASNNLALSLALSGNSARAVELLSELSRSYLDNPKVRQNLAFAYQMNGQESDSIRVSQIDLSAADSERNISVFKRFRSRG